MGKIFSTDGRMRRTHYFGWMFAMGFAMLVLDLIASVIFETGTELLVSTVASLPLYVAGYCLSLRRAHDMGRGRVFVASIYGTFAAGLILTLTGEWSSMTDGDAPDQIVGVGVLLLIASLVLSGMLSFGAPKDPNTWGPDPRPSGDYSEHRY
jgi:uncharacterized membrane protein YhaH (DUF805 family)